MKKQKSKLIFALLLSASMLFTSCDEKSDSSSSIEESKTSMDILSEEYSENSSESLENTSELYSDETLDETSGELSFDESDEFSSIDTSDEKTEESSEEVSDNSSEQTSNEISNDTSSTSSNDIEESSSETSESLSEDDSGEESSEDKVEEPSEKFGKEIMQEFPELDFAYCLYDIQTGNTIAEYNATELFSMSYTIKPAYVLYLLSEENINLTDTIILEVNDIDLKGKSYIRDYLRGKYNFGDSFTVKTLLEYSITKNDNTAYKMLTKTYGYSGFNTFMEKLNINIKLGDDKDPNYTSASCKEQLKVWIAINNYLNNSPPDLSQLFFKILKNRTGLKLSYHVIKEDTQSILGWEHSTSSLHECYIVEDKYIAIIHTTANISVSGSQDFTTIDAKPLEKIALGLKSVWESYNK